MDVEIVKQTWLDLEKRLLSPETLSSPEELNKLLADGFFEFGSSGNVWFKKDCVGDGGVGVRKLSLYGFEIKPLASNAVLATYRVNDETRKQQTLRNSIGNSLITDGE